METIITQALELRIWNRFDVQFAHFISKSNQKLLILASACLSSYVRNGHICLPLQLLTPPKLFNNQHPELAYQAWLAAGSYSINNIEEILLSTKAVGNGSSFRPLVLDNKKLYLHYMWINECKVANFFNKIHKTDLYKDQDIINTLNILFPYNTNDNWQKIAIAISIISPISFILGGPGTGKTSIIIKLLKTFMLLSTKKDLRIAIAAPTGKAANRLNQVLNKEKINLILKNNYPNILSSHATTIHRLLGAKLDSWHMKYNHDNKLNIDLLIIDEISMIDLFMLVNIIEALPDNIKVIFLGDQYQLSSVEPGSILSDICKYKKDKYSITRAKKLTYLTGCSIPTGDKHKLNISDNICYLKNNYRFHISSGIFSLANTIKHGDINTTLLLLNSETKQDLVYFTIDKNEDYKKMLYNCTLNYYKYILSTQYKCTINNVFKIFNKYQILCPTYTGPFGINFINKYIENELSKKKLIFLEKTISVSHYLGRPILILRNDPYLGLFNGDVGILLRDHNQELHAYFPALNNNYKKIKLYLLPDHETCFAMTVHKSQGSEFDHVTLILPNQDISVLTRELFYTAITRACYKLTLYASNKIITHTIVTMHKRYSGLMDRLKDY